jgi:hypothetical protein
MARAALRIEVRKKDQKALTRLLSGGVQQVRVVLRAMALLQLAPSSREDDTPFKARGPGCPRHSVDTPFKRDSVEFQMTRRSA